MKAWPKFDTITPPQQHHKAFWDFIHNPRCLVITRDDSMPGTLILRKDFWNTPARIIFLVSYNQKPLTKTFLSFCNGTNSCEHQLHSYEEVLQHHQPKYFTTLFLVSRTLSISTVKLGLSMIIPLSCRMTDELSRFQRCVVSLSWDTSAVQTCSQAQISQQEQPTTQLSFVPW